MYKLFFLLTLTISLCKLEAQEETYDRVFMTDVGIGLLSPQAAFKENISGNKIYFSVSGLAQIVKGKPFFGGIYIDGSSLQRFSSPVVRQTDLGFEFWNGNTKSNLFGTGLQSRFFTPFRPLGIQPFFDVNLGLNVMYTYTTFKFPDSDESSTIFDNTNTALSYGFGFGLNYPLSKRVYIKTKIGYHAGLSVRYNALEYLKIDQWAETTLEAYLLKQSTTDAIKWDIGVTFVF